MLGTLDQCVLVVEQRAVHTAAVKNTQRRLCGDGIMSVLLRQYFQRMEPSIAHSSSESGTVVDSVLPGIADGPLRVLLLSTLALVVGWTTGTTSISADSVGSWMAMDIASAKSGSHLPGCSWGWSPQTLTRVLVDVACFTSTVAASRPDLEALVTFTVTALSCLVNVGGEVGTKCLRRMLGCGFVSHILKDVKKMGTWLARIVRPQLVKEVRAVVVPVRWGCLCGCGACMVGAPVCRHGAVL